MYKEQAIKAIKEADITEYGWAIEIVDKIHDEYAAGYLKAKLERLGESLEGSDEEYRETLLEYCEYDIWRA